MTKIGAVRAVSAVSLAGMTQVALAAGETAQQSGSNGWLALGVAVFVGVGLWAFNKMM